MKNLILLLVFISAAFIVKAQQTINTNTDDFQNSFGIQLSSANGTGFAYRMKSNKSALSFVGTYFGSLSNDGGYRYYSFGMNYEYFFYEGELISFSLLSGTEVSNINLWEEERSINIGISPNIHLHLFDEVSINFHLGYGIYDLLDQPNSLITAGVGGYYHF